MEGGGDGEEEAELEAGPPYVWPCLGLLRNESGSNGRSEGEGDDGWRSAPGASGIIRSVSNSPPITGLGSRVSDSVATP